MSSQVNRVLRNVGRIAASVAVLMSANGCGKGITDSGIITPTVKVTFSQGDVSIPFGQSATVQVNVSGGKPVATLQSCVSTLPSIATANVSGSACVVTAVSAGTTQLTAQASDNKTSATIGVTVQQGQSITAVTVTPPSANLAPGGTVTLVGGATKTVTAVAVSYTFSSSNSSIASVTPQTGVVTAIAPGSAQITVTATGSATGFVTNSLSTTAPIEVIGPPALTSFAPPATVQIGVGGTFDIESYAQRASPSVTVTYTSQSSAIDVANTQLAPYRIVGLKAGTSTISITAVGTGSGYSASSINRSIVVTVLPPSLTGFTVTPLSSIIGINETLTPTQSALTANPSVDVAYTATSSDVTIARVSSTGVITGVAAGNARITYVANGSGTGLAPSTLSAGVDVRVDPQPNALRDFIVTPGSLNILRTGAPVQLSLRPVSNSPLLTVDYTFQVQPAGIVRVSNGGLVTPEAAGSAVITATATGIGPEHRRNSIAVQIPVVVTNPLALTNFNLNTGSLALGLGQNFALIPTPSTAGAAVNVSYAYSSSVPGVASVDGNGVIRGLTLGNTIITATATGSGGGFETNSISRTVPVTVTQTPAISSLTITPTTAALRQVGQTVALTASAVTAAGNVTVNYSYSSSNTSVATVNSAGLVTAAAAGSTTITVTAVGSGGGFVTTTLTGTALITVTTNPCDRRTPVAFDVSITSRFSSISCDNTFTNVKYGEFYQYTVPLQSRVRVTLEQSSATTWISPTESAEGWLWYSANSPQTALVPAGTFNFNFYSNTTPNDYRFRITRNPTDDCSPLNVVTGVNNATLVFNNTCGTRNIAGITASSRQLYLLPPLTAGQSYTLQAAAATFPIRMDLIDADTEQSVASAEAAANGGTATLNFAATASAYKFYYVLVNNRRATSTFGNFTFIFTKFPVTSLSSPAAFDPASGNPFQSGMQRGFPARKN